MYYTIISDEQSAVKRNTAITLTEVLVVVVIIGIISLFAIPSYNKAIVKSHERNAILNLKLLHGASAVYKENFGEYWDTASTEKDVSQINSQFNLNLINNEVTYTYMGIDISFRGLASYDIGGPNVFQIAILSGNISNTNPCCLAGTCAIVPACQNSCGDTVIHFGLEECDDGNLMNGDGCSTSCRIE